MSTPNPFFIFHITGALQRLKEDHASHAVASLFPLALQDEGRPIIWLSPLFLFPDRQLCLT